MKASWEDTWMGVADVIAKRSPCSRRQIGAVIVDGTNRIVATGHNGFPAHMLVAGCVKPRCTRDCPRGAGTSEPGVGYDDCLTIHAEANALMFCDRRDREGGTIYVTSAVCVSCAKLIANSGLIEVVMRVSPLDMHRDPEQAIKIITDSNINLRRIT